MTRRQLTIVLLTAVTTARAAAAQATSLADSVMRLNRAGQWDQAAQVALAGADAALSSDDRCALQSGAVYAFTRLGAYERAARHLRTLDEQCAESPVLRQQAPDLDMLRAELRLPPLPSTGLDFSAVDRFWRVAGLLARDIEPSEDEWRAMFSAAGYRLSMLTVPTTRADMAIALRPSRRAEFDSLTRLASDRATRLKHLAAAAANRAALDRYRDSVTRALPVQEATALAARFLPPRATEGKTPPLIAFALFRGDAYALPQGVVIDLQHAYAGNRLTLTLAHEFHHAFLSDLSTVDRPPVDHAASTLVNALFNMRNEGIADLIDKPYPLSAWAPANMTAYAARYDAAYARTPAVIRSIDSALVIAADDSTQLRAVGQRVQALLPSAGHFNGSYVARAIYETFGVDSLWPGIASPFAFLRTYAAARRGHAPPFSPKAIALLNELERRYRRR